jgi:hypothetical protein
MDAASLSRETSVSNKVFLSSLTFDLRNIFFDRLIYEKIDHKTLKKLEEQKTAAYKVLVKMCFLELSSKSLINDSH